MKLHSAAISKSGFARLQRLGVHLGPERRVVQRQPTVGDLGGHRDVLRPFGAEVDRHVGAQRVRDRLERLAQPDRAGTVVRVRVVLARELERRLAGEDAADDLDVLARAGERLAERLAVPALDDLRARHPETEDQAAVAQVVERERVHRGRGRRARRDLHDAGAELDRRRVRGDPHERRERVRAPRLRAPHRVEAELLGLLRELRDLRGRPRAPVPEDQSEFHVRSSLCLQRLPSDSGDFALAGGNFTGMCLIPAMKLERSGGASPIELEHRHAARHLLEQHVDLHPGEVRAEAVVRTTATEADVLVRDRA